MLDIRSLTKIFATQPQKAALNGLNLQVQKGEFVTVLGSNGAGKSTLFHAIAGEFFPDEGQILLEGKNITFQAAHQRSRFIGRVMQDPMKGTVPAMTVAENLALAQQKGIKGKKLFSSITKSQKEQFQEKLALLGLGMEDKLEQPAGLLSGGQRQALTLLMATFQQPKLLLLDEHTAALDPATAEKVMQLTQAVIEQHNITTLMITHNLAHSLAFGNRTILMDKGKIVMDVQGDQRKAYTPQLLMEQFHQLAGEETTTSQQSFALL